MKINQLFVKKVDEETLGKLMQCYNLAGFHDAHMFSKYDLITFDTVSKLKDIKSEVEPFYLRCKAAVYLENISVKKALTILKQVLRLYDYYLISIEKNINSKKVIYYKLISKEEKYPLKCMKQIEDCKQVNFD